MGVCCRSIYEWMGSGYVYLCICFVYLECKKIFTLGIIYKEQ